MTPGARVAPREIFLVLVAALVVRCAYLIDFRHTALFAAPVLDAAWQDELARAVALDGPTAGAPWFRPPLFAWLLGGMYALLGPQAWAGRILNGLGGLAVVLSVLVAGARLGLTGRYRLAAALAAALYAPSLFLEGELLAESVATALVAAGLVPAITVGSFRAGQRWFLVGMLWALAALARAPLAILPWVAAGLAFHETRRWRPAVLALSAAALVWAMPVLSTARAGGGLSFPAGHGGLNFYIGNHPGADGRSVSTPRIPARGWHELPEAAARAASQALGKPVHAAGADRYWWREGLRYWTEEPLGALGLTVRRALYVFHGFETANNRSLYAAREDASALGMLLWKVPGAYWPTGLLMPLALVGAWRVRRRRAWHPVLAVFGAVLLPLCVFFVAARFRAPALAPLALLAAPGIQSLASRRRGAWIAFVLGYALLNAPWPSAVSEDRRGEMLVRAEATLDAGRFEEAAARYENLLRIHPQEGRAILGLAAAREQAGRFDEAWPAAARAADLLPGYWAAEWTLARLLDRAGRTEDAAMHLSRAALDHPGHADVRASLGLTLEALSRDADARRELEEAARLGTRNAEAWNSVGRYRRLSGDRSGARDALDRALRLDPDHWKARFNRGLLAAEQGDVTGARRDLERVLAAAPDSASAQRVRGALAMLDRERR